MDVTPGSRLGPYEIVSRLGAGGMGEVFRARDTRLERSVAIKVLPEELARNSQFKVRFEREAKAISQLNHPNICTLYDVGDDYLVMELLEGETLAERIAKGPLPLADVLKFGAQVAEALDRAHRAGIVHRDLKPGNVMVTKAGAKLLDFGLAKTSTSSVDPHGETLHHDKPLTHEGTILGTFQYMAPEQLEAEEADPRTDIFALGALLYEMATGKRAFAGKTKTSLIAAIVASQPQPISQSIPLTPPALDHVIQKCLEKERDDRWQSAHDVAEELKWISEAGSQAGVAAPVIARKKWRERLAWSAAVVAALFAGAFAAQYLGREQPRHVYRFSIPTAGAGFREASTFAISPDGMRIAFNASDSERKRHVWIRRLDEPTAKRLEGSEGLSLGRFATDGQSLILGTTDGRITRIPADGGAPELVGELGPRWSSPRSTAAGVVIVCGPDGRIYRIDAPGVAPVPITTLDTSRSATQHQFPDILPGDKHFLFTSFRRDPKMRGFSSDLYAGFIDGSPARRIGEISSTVEYGAGHLYFVRDGVLLAAPFDLKALRITGPATAVTDGVAYFKPTGGAGFEVAANGTIAYATPGAVLSPRLMQWFDLRGGQLGTVGKKAPISDVEIAADGSRVYTAEADPRDGVSRLWSHGLRRPMTSRLSFQWWDESSPVISRDGKQLFYASDRHDFPDVYVKPADGSSEGRLLVREPFEQFPDAVSPDGRYLVYHTRKDRATTQTDLWAVPLGGGGKPFPLVQSPGVEGDATFSPDGRWIAYRANVSGTSQVYIKPFPTGGETRQISVEQGTRPRWSPDGKTLYFIIRRKMMAADPFGASEPRELFDAGADIQSFDVAPDGRRLLLLLQSEEDRWPPIQVIVGWRPPKK